MKRVITAITCLLLMAVVVSDIGCGSSEKTVLLRFDYDPGTQLTFRQDAVRRYTMQEADSTIEEGTSNESILITQTVRRVLEDSTAEVLESAQWDIVKPSKSDAAKTDTTHYTREMLLYITPTGRIVDVEFISETDSVTAAYLREYLDQGVLTFPEHSVKKGDSWTQSAEVSLHDTTANAATTYTVTDFVTEDGYDLALLSYAGDLVIPIEKSPEDTLQRSGIDRIHISGTLRYAYREGMIVSITENWKIDGRRERLKEGKMVQFHHVVDMDITYRLVEKKEAA